MLYTTLLKQTFRALYGETPGPHPEGPGVGLVIVTDGIGGLDLCGTGLLHEVGRAGLPLTVKVLPWGHGFGRWHADLTNVENHANQAEAIASEVNSFREKSPEGPVFLVGKSGGTGLVVWALERLPEGAVEAAVSLSSALSPRYDLSRALRAVRREVVAFYSPLDLFVLGAGTYLFGTIDRARSASAGMVGFKKPEGADDAAYEKLRQVRWHPAMVRTGYCGGHVGPDCPAFLRRYVLPLLAGSSPAHAAPIT